MYSKGPGTISKNQDITVTKCCSEQGRLLAKHVQFVHNTRKIKLGLRYRPTTKITLYDKTQAQTKLLLK